MDNRLESCSRFSVSFHQMYFSLIFPFLCFQEFFHVSFFFLKIYLQKHFQNQKTETLLSYLSHGMMVRMMMMSYAFSPQSQFGNQLSATEYLHLSKWLSNCICFLIFLLYNFLTIFLLTISLIVIDLCKRSHFLILLITIFRYNMIYGKHCNYTNLGIKIQI